MKLSTISLAALSTVATADWVAPEFCHQLDCPSFTTRQVDAEVEVRTYDELLWASTDVQSDSVTDAGSIAFGRLFGYLSGANENSQTIDMTSPVLNKISPVPDRGGPSQAHRGRRVHPENQDFRCCGLRLRWLC